MKNFRNYCRTRGGGTVGSAGGKDAKRQRCEANLEGRKLRRYEDRLLTENSSFLPLLGKDKRMGNNQYPPQPSLIREGATLFCHCERQNGASQSQDSCTNNEITTSNAPHSPRNDKESLCKTQVSGAAASCSLAFNGPTVDVCNGSTILPPSLCPQLARATLPRNDKFSSRFTLHPSLNKKAAFTLAEVLITLGIIGVVAAITIPSFIANYQKHVTVVQLKKAYTVFSQALERSVQDNGEVEYWDWQNLDTANQNFGEKYILPYLKGVSDADMAVNWKSLDGSINNFGSNIFTGGNMYSTSDGMLFRFSGLQYFNDPVNIRKTHLRVVIDINGRRGPNRYGRDVFIFSIFPFYEAFKGKLVPGTNDQCGDGVIHNSKPRDYLVSQGCWTCKSDYSGTGYACAALIMKDGWQIKDDYPW